MIGRHFQPRVAPALALVWFALQLHQAKGAAPILERATLSTRAFSAHPGRFRPALAVLATLADGSSVYNLAFAREGRELLALSTGGTLLRWDIQSGPRLLQKRQVKVPGSFHAISSDGRFLAFVLIDSRDDKSIHLWDVAGQKVSRRFEGSAHGIRYLTFSPDNKTLAAKKNNDIILWDVASGRQIHVLRGHQNDVVSVAYSPDGKVLASAAGEKFGRIWDVVSGKQVQKFTTSAGIYSAHLAFSPDGQLLAVGGSDFDVRLLHVQTGKELGCLRVPSFDWHGSRMDWNLRVTYSPDGRRLVAWWSEIRLIYQWEIATGKRLWEMEDESLAAMVADVVYSPCSTRLASAHWKAEKPAIILWNMLESGTQEKAKPIQLSGRRLNQSWADLASDDAVCGWDAIGAFARAPRQSVPFLRSRMKPIVPVDSRKVLPLIAALDHPQFAARKKAGEELELLGEGAVLYLRKAIRDKPSLEVRQRCEQLLRQLEGPLQGERLRQFRAVAALEFIATPEAWQLLAELAKGETAARQTQEAQAALRRLKR